MDPHFDGVIFKTHTAELRRRLSRPFPPFCIVDVRWRGEHDRGHIPGALNILPENIKTLPPGATPHTEIFVVGEIPEDPAMRQASLALKGLGAHRIVELTGGMTEWKAAGGPLEKSVGEKAA